MASGDATSVVEARSTPTPHAKWRPPFSFQIRTGSVLIYSADPHHSEGTGQHVLVLAGLAPWRWTPEPATPLNASEPDDRHTTVLGVLVELLDGQARTCHMRVVPPQHLHPLPGRAEHTEPPSLPGDTRRSQHGADGAIVAASAVLAIVRVVTPVPAARRHDARPAWHQHRTSGRGGYRHQRAGLQRHRRRLPDGPAPATPPGRDRRLARRARRHGSDPGRARRQHLPHACRTRARPAADHTPGDHPRNTDTPSRRELSCSESANSSPVLSPACARSS
jgi:hypothetical protein